MKHPTFNASFFLLFSIIFQVGCTTEHDNKEASSQTLTSLSIPSYTRDSKKPFDDVVEDLLISIGEHNFRLTSHSRIGKAIAERTNTEFPLATVIHFCNLKYAQELLNIDLNYLLKMPCRIAIHETPNKRTVIQTWLLPEDDEKTAQFSQKINSILIEIVDYGVN